jgi:hypothetical protein
MVESMLGEFVTSKTSRERSLRLYQSIHPCIPLFNTAYSFGKPIVCLLMHALPPSLYYSNIEAELHLL